MAYITAVFDRTQADIVAQTSKAFLNVVDWIRIYGNSLETNTDLNTALGLSILFNTITTVVTTDIPTAAEINEFLANIERMRLWIATYAPIADSDFTEIRDDWLAGQSSVAPNFADVNSWEKVLDIIYQIYKSPYATERVPIGGVATCGAGLTRQNWFRG